MYQFVSGYSAKSSDGKAGVTPDLYVTRVRLKHLPSGTEVQRVAIHAVAGIDTLNGGPGENVIIQDLAADLAELLRLFR